MGGMKIGEALIELENLYREEYKLVQRLQEIVIRSSEVRQELINIAKSTNQ